MNAGRTVYVLLKGNRRHGGGAVEKKFQHWRENACRKIEGVKGKGVFIVGLWFGRDISPSINGGKGGGSGGRTIAGCKGGSQDRWRGKEDLR